jgi:hypothetical protein
VEALATRTFPVNSGDSRAYRNPLVPCASRAAWYPTRRIGANRLPERLSFQILLKESLGCAFDAIRLRASVPGLRIETAEINLRKKKAYNKSKGYPKATTKSLSQLHFKDKTTTDGKLPQSRAAASNVP